MTQTKHVNCVILLGFAALLACISGCGKPSTAGTKTSADTPDRHAGHLHEPQNGGVPIAIGDDQFYLELVHEPGAALMSAYVFDGHMEDYVRLSQSSFEIKVTDPKPERVLSFHAVANRATGETEGTPALFQAESDWLKQLTRFDGVILSIEI